MSANNVGEGVKEISTEEAEFELCRINKILFPL